MWWGGEQGMGGGWNGVFHSWTWLGGTSRYPASYTWAEWTKYVDYGSVCHQCLKCVKVPLSEEEGGEWRGERVGVGAIWLWALSAGVTEKWNWYSCLLWSILPLISRNQSNTEKLRQTNLIFAPVDISHTAGDAPNHTARGTILSLFWALLCLWEAQSHRKLFWWRSGPPLWWIQEHRDLNQDNKQHWTHPGQPG